MEKSHLLPAEVKVSGRKDWAWGWEQKGQDPSPGALVEVSEAWAHTEGERLHSQNYIGM